MSKIVLTDLVNLENQTTAVNAINSNNSVLETAFDNTLSRDGTNPNKMSSNLDMDSNDILNLPTPVSNFSPVRLIDLNGLRTGGTVTVNPLPTGGTVGQLLTKNSSTNFDTSWKDIPAITGVPTGGAIGTNLVKKTATSNDTIWSPMGYVTPEMFGAVVGSDCTTAINSAITYLSANGGGVLKFGLGQYKTSGITIATSGITLEGCSMTPSGGSSIVFTPLIQDSACIDITAGASIISDIQIRNLTVTTTDTTAYKTGIRISDGSVVQLNRVWVKAMNGGVAAGVTNAVASPSGEIRLTISTNPSTIWNDGYVLNVSGIAGTIEANYAWPIIVVSGTQVDLKGSVFTNAFVSGGTATSASVAVQLKGRELFSFMDTFLVGDVGLRISKNPNFSTYALDESNFQNLTASSTGTAANILVDDGVCMTSCSWTGVQSWGGGKSGFQWRDRTGAAISEQIVFENVRSEQASTSGGWIFDISPNGSVYSLVIANLLCGSHNGARLRNLKNFTMVAPHFVGATTALDIDSTVENTAITGAYAIAGSSTNISGQNIIYQTANNTGGAFSSFIQYSSTLAPAQTQAGLVIGSAAVATNATGPFLWVNSCAGTPTGVPSGSFTGRFPVLYDSSANKIWVYNGSWRGVAVT